MGDVTALRCSIQHQMVGVALAVGGGIGEAVGVGVTVIVGELLALGVGCGVAVGIGVGDGPAVGDGVAGPEAEPDALGFVLGMGVGVGLGSVQGLVVESADGLAEPLWVEDGRGAAICNADHGPWLPALSTAATWISVAFPSHGSLAVVDVTVATMLPWAATSAFMTTR